MLYFTSTNDTYCTTVGKDSGCSGGGNNIPSWIPLGLALSDFVHSWAIWIFFFKASLFGLQGSLWQYDFTPLPSPNGSDQPGGCCTGCKFFTSMTCLWKLELFSPHLVSLKYLASVKNSADTCRLEMLSVENVILQIICLLLFLMEGRPQDNHFSETSKCSSWPSDVCSYYVRGA